MKLIFIVGPYSASSRMGVVRNIADAREVAEQLAEAGLAFICPHLNSAHMHDLNGVDYWYTAYLYILLKCDAAITFGDWQKSVGATAEVAAAEQHGIPVFHDFDKLRRWYNRQLK